ncbi:porin [Acidovorax sp.]|uniref:porin n=1 Tax=Acidovorax sp. TaxID=1872122 RepID=UPI00391F57BF
MKKKLIPIAIGSLLGTVSIGTHAQASYTIFGNFAAQMESISATDSVTATGAPSPLTDRPNRLRLSNVSSDLGVRASVKIGNGLTGVASAVTGLNADGSTAQAGMWGTAKDVFVGLSFDEAGTLKLGRLTGAARWISGTPDFSPAGAGPQDNQAALSGAAGIVSPLFNARLDNAIGFESVRWNGFSVRGYYSANEGKSNSAVTTGQRISDHSYSLGAQYVNGPLDLRAAYELRNDKQTLNAGSGAKTSDKVYRIGARYTLPTSTIVAITFDRQNYSDDTATGTARRSLSKSGWVIGAKHNFGKHAVYGGFGSAGNYSGRLANGTALDGANTGMRQVVLAYNYAINKELVFDTFVSVLQNRSRARYDYDSGGLGSIGSGAKLTAIGAGLRYSF